MGLSRRTVIGPKQLWRISNSRRLIFRILRETISGLGVTTGTVAQAQGALTTNVHPFVSADSDPLETGRAVARALPIGAALGVLNCLEWSYSGLAQIDVWRRLLNNDLALVPWAARIPSPTCISITCCAPFGRMPTWTARLRSRTGSRCCAGCRRSFENVEI